MPEYRGSFTVTVTPFDPETEAYDEKLMRSFVDWQIAEGVPGLIILGSMGEVVLIDDDERTHIVSSVIDQVRGRVPVFVGTQHAWTAAIRPGSARSRASTRARPARRPRRRRGEPRP